MAYQLFTLPKQLNISSSFTLAAGAKAYFYATGTTTPQNTYTTSALSVAHPNPVVADAAGVLPAIYLDPSLQYKLTLNTAADVLIYTVDPVNDQILSASAIAALVNVRTSVESGVGVTPSNYFVPSHDQVGFILAARYGFAEAASAATNLAALTAALAVKASIGGGIILLPPGDFDLTSEFTINSDDTVIMGAGSLSTRINFSPSGTAVCFNFDGGGSSLERVGVIGVGFSSSNSNTKTAIRFEDCRDFKVHDIIIASGAWGGSASVGVHTLGRDTLDFYKVHILCARPVLIDKNPNNATLDSDHFHFHDYEVASTETTGKAFEIVSGVHLTNVTWDGYGAVELGKYGIFYDDTATTIDSYNVKISGIRTEQATDATGYSIYLASTAQDIKAITIENCNFDSGRNGIFLRKPECVGISNCFFTGSSGRTNLDITFQSKTILEIDGTDPQPLSTVTLTNAVLVRGAPQNTSTEVIPKSVTYRYDEGAVVSQKPAIGYNNQRIWGTATTLANGAQISTPFTRAAYTAATITVTAYSATGPIHCTGTAGWTKDGTVTKHGGSANFVAVAAGVAIWCVDGGSGLIVLNNLGQQVTIVITISGVV